MDVGAERWMQVSNPESGDFHDISVRIDTQSPVNWILPRVARECGLDIIKTSEITTYVGFDGESYYNCDSYVDVTWNGQGDKIRRTRFYISPANSPIELLVSEEFTKQYGKKALFTYKPSSPKPRPVLVVAQKKLTVRNNHHFRTHLINFIWC
jgi:hypothetical protein